MLSVYAHMLAITGKELLQFPAQSLIGSPAAGSLSSLLIYSTFSVIGRRSFVLTLFILKAPP